MSPDAATSRLWLVAAEWVVSDDGREIRLGEVLDRDARLADTGDDGDLQPVLARILGDATGRPTIYAWHAEDPEPPVTIRGTVVRIWSLPLPTQSSADWLDGVREVSVAAVGWKVDRYILDIDGEATPSRYWGGSAV